MLQPQLYRYPTAVGAGILITGGLLFVMQAMIATGRDPVVEAPPFLMPTFVRSIIEQPPIQRQPPERVTPPATPPPGVDLPGDSGGTTVRVAVPPPTGPNRVLHPAQYGISDATPIALVKVAAVYPHRAIGRELEGYVIVEYTVTRTGSVTDIIVLESSHAIFERNAIAAAEQFRYRPRVVGGEAVDTPGVLNKFTFELED